MRKSVRSRGAVGASMAPCGEGYRACYSVMALGCRFASVLGFELGLAGSCPRNAWHQPLVRFFVRC
uniref:Uncharacterized protein n=1 Tax=Arundo donax TaxID=35708 RepID=A0A0A9FDB0_ARUDO